MKTRPLILDGPTIRAILDGSTKQVQIPVKWPVESSPGENHIIARINEAPGFWIGIPMVALGGMIPVQEMPCPYSVGDRWWVRETWQIIKYLDPEGTYKVWGDDDEAGIPKSWPRNDWLLCFRANPEDHLVDMIWRPSVHMPRWASRLTLEITAVSVEWSQERDEWVWMVGVERVEEE